MPAEGSEVFEGRLPRMVRTQLGELVQENGAEILQDPRRVRAMLGDTIATARREINLISLALSEGVPDRLQALAGDPLRIRAEIAALTRQLERNHALHHDAAEWAVRSCAWSLGLDEPPEQYEPAPALPPYEPPTPVADVPAAPSTEPIGFQPLAGGLGVPPPGAAQRASTADEPAAAAPANTQAWWRQPLVLGSGGAAAVLLLVLAIVFAVNGPAGNDNRVAGGSSPFGHSDPSTDGSPPTTLPTTGDPSTAEPSTTAPTTSDPTDTTPTQTTPTETSATGKPHHRPPPPPAPFRSAALFAFAKPYFRPAQCFVPTASEAPVATQTPDRELLKCGSGQFTATFWRKSSMPGLMKDRALFFHDRQGAFRYLVGAPADAPRPVDGVERAYHHVNSNDPRVYWDSRTSLCAAEIQGNDGATMADTIRFWREGRR